MIRFACRCGRQLQAHDEDAGKQARCPECQRINDIPDEPPPRRPTASAAVQDRRQRRREDEYDDQLRRERDDRPDRFDGAETSGKAIAALVLGLLAFPCVGMALTGIPAIIFGILALRNIGSGRGMLKGQGLAVAGIVLGVLGVFATGSLALLIPIGAKMREAAARIEEQKNHQRIGVAMHEFEGANRRFPAAAAFRSKEGKPLLSWRVALLPYIDQDALYQQFRLDEPWDSEHNLTLLPLIPKVYLQPGQENDGSGKTYYQVVVGPGTMFEERIAPPPPGRLRLGRSVVEITDGASNTLMVVTARDGVPWTKPEDLVYDPKASLPNFSQRFSAVNVLFADGEVRGIPRNTPEVTWRAMITRNGGEAFAMP